jgi:iron complex transport system ATP-binding protein
MTPSFMVHTLSSDSILRAEGLSVQYDSFDGDRSNARPVLSNVSTEIKVGEWVALIGPNGCGKSTFLKSLAGFFIEGGVEFRGSVSIDGFDFFSMSPSNRIERVGYLGTTLETEFLLSVNEAIEMGRLFRVDGEASSDTELEEILRDLDLTALRDRHLHTLSGGERQRVLIARGIYQGSKFLILDETFSQMDLHHQVKVGKWLRDRVLKKQLTVIWVSHDLNLCLRWATRVILMNQGQIAHDGAPGEVVTVSHLTELYPGSALEVKRSGDKIFVHFD